MATGQLCVENDGQHLEVSFPDTDRIRELLRNILLGNEYPLLPQHMLQPDCVIDIGANVGATAVYFASHYPDARILCFEPSPSNVRYLYENTKHLPHVSVFNVGLADRDTQTRLYLGKFHCLQHSIFRGWGVEENYEEVVIRRASAALGGLITGRCILKVDCEGCEVSVLRDLRPVLDSIDVVYIEYHSERDRLRFDDMLASRFKLWNSTAKVVHRGNLAYISRALLQRWPELEEREIVNAL